MLSWLRQELVAMLMHDNQPMRWLFQVPKQYAIQIHHAIVISGCNHVCLAYIRYFKWYMARMG